MASITLLLSFFVLLFLGTPIALALGGSAFLYVILFTNVSPIIVAQQIYSNVNTFTLLAVPFFVMAGALMEYGGISKRVISFSKSLVGHYTGGLALVVVVASVFFAAMTGSGVAACAAVGGIMVPEMIKAGYDKDFSCALQGTAGIFGPLIPPSIAMVIYATIANESVSTMLLAGVGPGLLEASLVAIIAVMICRKKGWKGEGHFDIRLVWQSFKDSFWALLSPAIILGGIYSGVFTPTEAAGVSCFYSIVVGLFVYKEMTLKILMKALASATKSAAGIMLIVGASGAFSWVITKEHIARNVANIFLSLTDNKYVFLLLAVLIVLIAGCFIDSIPIITILTPILVPVAASYGVSLVHLGGLMVTGTCIGLITPPMGLNLFMGAQLGNRPVHKVIKWIIPFVIVTIVGLLLEVFIPGIVTALPNLAA